MIDFSVADAGRAVVKVFNTIGEEVAVLFDGQTEPGRTYRVTFEAHRLPTGLYYARLEAGGKSVVKKMLLVK